MSEDLGGGPPRLDLGGIRDTSRKEMAGRFLFGAAIAVVAGFLGKRIGPLAGGLFLAFPAILPAALTLLEKKDGTREAEVNALGAILGTVALAVFGLVAAVGLRRYSPWLALGLAAAAWLVTAIWLYFVFAEATALIRKGRRRG